MTNKQFHDISKLLEQITQYMNRLGKPSRIIIHKDCDCYECQVYARKLKNFNLEDYPVVVANPSGRITSVNYKARDYDLSRNIRVEAAREKCPQLKVLQMPYNKRWGKADTSLARHASWEILDSVLKFRRNQPKWMTVQHTSCDDYYFDVTDLVDFHMNYHKVPKFSQLGPNTYFEGEKLFYNHVLDNYMDDLDDKIYNRINQNECEENARLLHGAVIAGKISQWVKQETGFQVSCGVGHNKVMAKLATGLSKPNGITILPFEGLKRVARNIDIENIRGLGGDRGQDLMDEFEIRTMLDLQRISKKTLKNYFRRSGLEDFGEKVEDLRFGIDSEPVEEKIMTNTINCGKTFHDVDFSSFSDFTDQITYLVEEIMERIDEEKERYDREPDSLKIELTMWNHKHSNVSSTMDWYYEDEAHEIVQEFLKCLRPKIYSYKGVKSMVISVPKFIPID